MIPYIYLFRHIPESSRDTDPVSSVGLSFRQSLSHKLQRPTGADLITSLFSKEKAGVEVPSVVQLRGQLMSRDKGKQRASVEDVDDVDDHNSTPNQPSFLNRLANSTGALAASFTNAPATTSALASSHGEKGQAIVSTHGPGLPVWMTNGYAQPPGFGPVPSGFRESFRQPSRALNTQHTQIDGEAETMSASGWGQGQVDAQPTNAWAGEFNTLANANAVPPTPHDQYGSQSHPHTPQKSHSSIASPQASLSAVQFAERTDGAAVLNLLDMPGMLVPEEGLATEIADSAEVDASDLFGSDIQASQNASLAHLRPDIPVQDRAGQHGDIPPANPRNLHPDITTLAPDGMVMSETAGVEDVNAWLAGWSDVLERYTDDVWGDSLGVVKDARNLIEEVRQREETKGGEEGKQKALRRLRAVLAHIQLPGE